MKKLSFLVVLVLFTALAYGQPQKGAVIGVYGLKVNLNPDVTMNQFLDFEINEYIPAFEKHAEGVKVYFLKEYRGAQGFQYGLMIYCESVEVYDKYWDKEGLPTEALNKIYQEPLQDLNKKASKFGSLGWDFTDWEIL